MARKHEAASLLRAGYSPREIASEMEITISSVMQYLYTQIGEGAIRRSDIVFSISADTRDLIEALIRELDTTYWYKIYGAVEKRGHALDRDDLKVYLALRDARISMGDMYEFISEIEITLHQSIKRILVSKYGPGENGWWRQGIPLPIRKVCVVTREGDPEPAEEPYSYTTFVHLRDVLDKQWGLFSQILPKAVVTNKKAFLGNFVRLNHIRNCVMHPVKGVNLEEDDFTFVRDFRESIQPGKWRNFT